MRNIITLLMFTAILCPVKAQDDYSMIIVNRHGKTYAVRTSDVNNIHFDATSNVNSDLFTWEEKVSVEKNIYHCVTSQDEWHINVENPLVSQYINEVDYTNDCDTYTVTHIDKYISPSTDYRKDQPRGIQISWDTPHEQQHIILSRTNDFSVIDETINIADNETNVCLYNLIPGCKYYYKVMAGQITLKQSHFYTTGCVRMMHLNSVRNIRDIGGWPTEDGQRLRYGKIFRGGELNNSSTLAEGLDHTISNEDIKYMHDVMNIRLDMDLRDGRDLRLNDDDKSNDMDYTMLGDDVEYRNEMVNHHTEYFTTYGYHCNQRWGRTLKYIINTLKNGHSVYFHCTWGADRTGMLAVLIEGLCGVTEADLSKEYELTAFEITSRNRLYDYFKDDIAYIKSLSGATLADKFATYCRNAGVTQEEINTLREIMIEK